MSDQRDKQYREMNSKRSPSAHAKRLLEIATHIDDYPDCADSWNWHQIVTMAAMRIEDMAKNQGETTEDGPMGS